MPQFAEAQPDAASRRSVARLARCAGRRPAPAPRRAQLASALAGLLAATGSGAQAPLSIEQLIAPARRWQLITGLDFGTVTPTPFEERRDMGSSLTLRYGLSSRFEVSARHVRQAQELRFPGGENSTLSRGTSLGASWLAYREGRWPALLLETRVDLATASSGQRRSGGGGALSLTTWRSIDPVVLSMTAAWERRGEVRGEGIAIAPGDRWRIEPLVSFAVNPQVTLLGGASLRYSGASRVDDRPGAASRSALGYRLGIGYAPDAGNTLFLIADGGTARDAARLSLQWIYEF